MDLTLGGPRGAEAMTAAAVPATDVAAAAAGDVSAFERLVRANQNLVCSLAFSICGSVEESEDVAQETFLAAWQRLPKLRQPESFRGWLRQLTRNRAYDSVRARLRARRSSDRSVTLEDAAEVIDGSLSVRDRLILAEQQAAVQAALEKLPDQSREVLVLFYREGRSILQVAELLDLSEVAVRKRLSRARGQMREDVAALLGDVLVRTAPTAAFTTTVVAALTFAAPATAAAAGTALSLKASSAAAGSSAVWGGVLSGLTAGLMAVRFGLRGSLARAIDEEERRGVRRWALFASLSMIAFLSGIILMPYMHRNFSLALGWVAGYWLALNASVIYLTRVTKRRRDLLRLEDPAEWRRDQRRTILGFVGSVILLFLICGGLALGFHLKGLL